MARIVVRMGLSGTSFQRQVERFGIGARGAVEAALEGFRQATLERMRREIGAAFPKSSRMPTTITATLYPSAPPAKPEPVVWIHPRKGSNIAQVLESHRGSTVKARNGTFLAIPTAAAIQINGGKRPTPSQIEKKLATAKVGRGAKRRSVKTGDKGLAVAKIPTSGGERLALVSSGLVVGRSGRLRAATDSRLALGQQSAGSAVMFWLVRSVTLPTRLRPETIVEEGVRELPALTARAARTLGVG